jgi:hypothetical protein
MQRVEKCRFLLAETPHLFKPHKKRKKKEEEEEEEEADS